ACAFLASRSRSASVNRRHRPPNRSLSTRFSSSRYAITSSWRRLTQPPTISNKTVRGANEGRILFVILSRTPYRPRYLLCPAYVQRLVLALGQYGRAPTASGH